jgi:hypothetical protein
MLENSMKLGSWADEMNRNNAEKAGAEAARRAALTPEQRAAENAAIVARNAAQAAVAAHPAVRAARFAAPMARAALPPLAPRRPVAAAAWRPPAGKTMRECRNSNVSHAHESGAACKYVHKNENAYGHLRPDQKRPGGGKASRRSSRKASRRSSRKANRKSRRNGGGNIKIVPSPAPLSKVDTYTSWPGGIDPTVPLYNQRTMLGGKRSEAKRNTRRNSSRRNNRQ